MDNIRHIGNTRPQKSLSVKEMAAQHRTSMASIGGHRKNFLHDVDGRHISQGERKWYRDKGIIFVSLGIALIWIYLIYRIMETGFTLYSNISIAVIIISFIAHARNIHIWKKIESKKTKIRHELAVYFEPEGIWNIDYPEKGEKAEMITAVIAARKYLNLLEAATTLPIHVPSRDPYYTQMVKTIIDSKEDDISPYIYDEINYLCDSTKEYLNIYGSLISLEIDLRLNDIKK